MNIPAVRRLEKAGAEVRPGDLATLSWDVARNYHLIIAIDERPAKRTGDGAASVERWHDL